MMMHSRLILLVLLGLVNAESPSAIEALLDDDQPLINRLTEYVANVRQPMNASYGYKRLNVLLNKTSEMLDFFEFLGYLFINGTLGLCLDVEVSSCTIYINPNGSRFNTKVAEFLYEDEAQTDKAYYDIERYKKDILPAGGFDGMCAFCDWRCTNNQLEQERKTLTLSMQDKLKAIFNDTWDFNGDLIWRLNYLLLGQRPYGDEQSYRYYYETSFRSKCHKFEAANAGANDRGDVAIRSLVDLMGASCENPAQNSSLRSQSEQLARLLAFNGGTSNRCFQNFAIRYYNYTATQYEYFVDFQAKYLYRDTLLHGLCLFITRDGSQLNGTERSRRKEWVVQNLNDIGRWLMDARVLLKEPPPVELPNELDWSKIKSSTEDAIGDATISYPSPDGAVDQYKGIYEKIKTTLVNASKQSRATDAREHMFQVLVYYPAYDSSDHCICGTDSCDMNTTQGVLRGSARNVNYVVARSLPLRNADVTVNVVKLRPKMKQLFGDSELCKRTKELYRKLGDKDIGLDGIRAIAAIRCAKKFVWYELAYLYFQAAYTKAPNVEVPQIGSTYNGNCGMVVLFT